VTYLKKVLKGMNRSIISILIKVSKESLLPKLILLLIMLHAFLIRITPLRWGMYLTEFDPYYEFYLSKFIASKGLAGILWWFDPQNMGFRDTMFWYPEGRVVTKTSQPGGPLLAALIFMILKSLGFNINLLTVYCMLPSLSGAFLALITYIWGRYLHSKFGGLIAALLISLDPSLISSTTIGNVHDCVAMLFIVLSFYLLTRAFNEDNKIIAILSGICMGLAVLIWGGFLYAWNLIALYVLILQILGKTSRSIDLNYILFNLIATFFVIITPRHGLRVGVFSLYAILPWLATINSVYILSNIKIRRTRIGQLILMLAVIMLAIIGWKMGVLSGIAGRIAAIIIPSERSAIVESVMEHRIPTWSMIYSDFQYITFFSLFGLYICLYKKINHRLFLALYGISSLYAAMSMARLIILFVPALSLLIGIGLSELHINLFEIMSIKRIRTFRRKNKIIRKEVVITAFILINSLFFLIIVQPYPIYYAHQPSLILTSSLPVISDYSYQYLDWISALEWIRMNTPKDSVIISWWDYGYWISVNTNRCTTIDNATLNTTKIAQIALAFMSNETIALKIFKKFNASYVVVFEPFQSLPEQYTTFYRTRIFYPDPVGRGDFGKSLQMIKIAGLNPDRYQTYAKFGTSTLVVPANTIEAKNALLYKLLFIKTDRRYSYIFENIFTPYGPQRVQGYNGPIISFESPKNFKLVYASYPNQWVLIYKIVYNETGS